MLKTMNRFISATFLFLISRSADAQFEKYYSDEVGGGLGDFGLLLVILVMSLIFIFGGREVKRGLAYFLALFALPLILGKIGFAFLGMVGGLLGGLLGCYLWIRLGAWLDS